MQGRQLDGYLAAMEEAIEAMDNSDERAAATEWLDWAKKHRASLDPLSGPISMPPAPEATADMRSSNPNCAVGASTAHTGAIAREPWCVPLEATEADQRLAPLVPHSRAVAGGQRPHGFWVLTITYRDDAGQAVSFEGTWCYSDDGTWHGDRHTGWPTPYAEFVDVTRSVVISIEGRADNEPRLIDLTDMEPSAILSRPETASDRATRSRRSQGLPDKVEDPETLRRIAALLWQARRG